MIGLCRGVCPLRFMKNIANKSQNIASSSYSCASFVIRTPDTAKNILHYYIIRIQLVDIFIKITTQHCKNQGPVNCSYVNQENLLANKKVIYQHTLSASCKQQMYVCRVNHKGCKFGNNVETHVQNLLQILVCIVWLTNNRFRIKCRIYVIWFFSSSLQIPIHIVKYYMYTEPVVLLAFLSYYHRLNIKLLKIF